MLLHATSFQDIIGLQEGQKELKDGLVKLDRGQTSLKRRMKRVEKDISYMVATFDTDINKNKKRLDRIEDSLHLPPYKN